MLIVDSQGAVRAVGESLARLVGVPAEDLVGRPVAALLPEWRPSSDPRMRYLLRLPTVDLSISVRLAWRPILHDASEALFIVEVETSARRMALLGNEAIMVTERNGVILYVNHDLETMTGFHRSELLGRTPAMLKSGLHDAGLFDELWRTILEGRVYQGVLINRRKNGERYREEKIIRPVRDAEGRPLLFFSCAHEIDGRSRRSPDTQPIAVSP
jgi:PAS domain S-box-containing protein